MERQIGEIFQDGEVTLKVEEEKEFMTCVGCYYRNQEVESCYDRDCTSFRTDKTSVIFVKQ